ncbi:MAG: recombinase family protein [Acidobacteriaceae bacterium]
MSEKIKSHHLERKAILYVRQSSTYQVVYNEESRRLQYAMRERLVQLGWNEVEVIDEDQGRSAAGTVERSGFERMVADVCLGKVGAVAAREVSRFARNSREWQQLVEVCRIVDTLLIDHEVVYAPRQSNDRLLLGLKGSLNEYELDLLRQRSLEARYEKARRGEMVVVPPVGYLKTEDQSLEKDPDRRIQQRILLVFSKFQELGSVRQTLLWFLEEGLEVPARDASGTISWKRPRYSSIHSILTNPTYGGAYVFGRTEYNSQYAVGQVRTRSRRRPREQWISLIPHHHEGYIAWEQFEAVQATIAGNCLAEDRPGAPKRGAALLAGILRCRRCGRKLTVAYTGADTQAGERFLRYVCNRGSLDNGEAKCISFGGVPVDKAIGEEVLRVVRPAAVEAAVQAHQEMVEQRNAAVAALDDDLQAARYAAQRAQKQYDAADPENRLVADELERRWNRALAQVRELEQRIEQLNKEEPEAVALARDQFVGLADELEAVWHDPQSNERLKKRIVRMLMKEVLVDIDEEHSEVVLTIHWQGGVHTELRVARRRRGTATQTAPDTIAAVRVLACVSTDEMIASFLNRNNLRTGRGNRWTKERITSLRSYHQIPCHSAESKEREGWLTLTEAAEFLHLSSRTVRLAVERGEISGEHPLGDGPWVFRRSDLETPAAGELVRRAHNYNRRRAVPNGAQKELEFTRT